MTLNDLKEIIIPNFKVSEVELFDDENITWTTVWDSKLFKNDPAFHKFINRYGNYKVRTIMGHRDKDKDLLITIKAY